MYTDLEGKKHANTKFLAMDVSGERGRGSGTWRGGQRTHREKVKYDKMLAGLLGLGERELRACSSSSFTFLSFSI